ncbi:uncharacterized protein [Oscarella lobularis]|uniref:uncharacterized protein n=1 Tax=Oscarella lobularis TaxID=121494 RepID=UPI0033135258
MFVPLLLFCASLLDTERRHSVNAITAVTGGNCKEPIGNWCRLTSPWISNRPLGRDYFLIAAYQRSTNVSSPGLTRILIFGGYRSDCPKIGQMTDSWILCPETNTWTPAMLPRTQHFYNNWQSSGSLTRLCLTEIILLSPMLNETWLFDGTREEWVSVTTSQPVPPTRIGYSVSAVPNEKSLCHCKKSLLLYGGAKPDSAIYYNELWELRCVDDSVSMYKWINVTPNSLPNSWPPKLFRHTSFVIQTDMYVMGGRTPEGLRSEGVWKFDVQSTTWTLYDRQTLNDITQIYGTVFLSELGVMMFVDGGRVLFYEAATRKISTPAEFDFSPLEKIASYFTGGLTAVDKSVYLIGPLSSSLYLKTWTIEGWQNMNMKPLNSSYITLNSRPSRLLYPDLSLSAASTTGLFAGEIFFYVDRFFQFWRLDLNSNMWTLYNHDKPPDLSLAAVSAFGQNYLVAFAPDNEEVNIYYLWIYKVKQRLWIQVETPKEKPAHRQYRTLTVMRNKSLILHGNSEDPTELWILTVNMSMVTATWYRPLGHGNQIIFSNLGQNIATQAAVFNDNFYVFGGTLKNGSCNSNVFQVNLKSSSAPWQSLKQLHSASCVRKTAVLGRHVFYVATDGFFAMLGLDKSALWMFDLLEGTQEKITEERGQFQGFAFLANYKVTLPIIPYKPGDYHDIELLRPNKIFLLKLTVALAQSNYDKTKSWSLYTLQLDCSPGTASRNFNNHPCLPCPPGTYSDVPGAVRCKRCPSNLFTASNRSNSLHNCSCDPKACNHGRCILSEIDYTIECVCDIGFTGATCQFPTQYLIASAAVIVILIVIVLAYFHDRTKRHQEVASGKEEELQETKIVLGEAEKTLNELSNIWSVPTKEIVFLVVIGYGSFGDVWSAEYRDQIVAVKVLKIKAEDCTEEQLQDFNDESELLRSIFHANIVPFIGTGKNDEGKPFIVLEYMERGSVRKELDTNYAHTPMELKLQVKWGLDAAKGMRHLHSIGRMHRDLKCDNLLINDRGVVKVADLGCTKLVPKIAEGHQRGTRAVGTALFRAPEIIRGRDYDSSVDIYSYGITLWEIQTAKNPYVDQLQVGVTVRDILDRVVGEELRPEFPAYCDKDMIELTKSCWQMSPFRRPTFDEIVLKLEAICFRDQIVFK